MTSNLFLLYLICSMFIMEILFKEIRVRFEIKAELLFNLIVFSHFSFDHIMILYAYILISHIKISWNRQHPANFFSILFLRFGFGISLLFHAKDHPSVEQNPTFSAPASERTKNDKLK